MLFCLIVSVLSATAGGGAEGPRRPELCCDRRNVCLAARSLSPLPHAVNSNIGPAENQRAEPCGEHRRRNVRSPAATGRALRGARRALLAPDCCPCCRQKCPGNQFSSLCDIFWLVTAQKIGGIRRCRLFVRTVRLELTQANAHYPLKVACLPFHHVRITLGLQSYAEFIYLQIFRPKNPIFSARIRSPFLPHATFLPSASPPGLVPRRHPPP